MTSPTVSGSTSFNIGSLGEMFTAVAIAKKLSHLRRKFENARRPEKVPRRPHPPSPVAYHNTDECIPSRVFS
jgi:hypothetical protein